MQRIFRAQQLHDRKHYDDRMSTEPEKRQNLKYIDYLRPIIADGDTGYVSLCSSWSKYAQAEWLISRHGGLSTVMKLAKLFAESVRFIGAIGLHLRCPSLHLSSIQGVAAFHLEDQLHGGKKVQSLSTLLISHAFI